MSTPGWDGILDPGEEIVWQGRPDARVAIRAGNIAGFVFGLAFAGFALFWMVMASQAGGFFWAFGLIHFSVGLGLAFGAVFWGAWVRRHTWYTLTDRRAFIATDLPMRGRTLKSYPIAAETPLDFAPGPPDSVFFGAEFRTTKNGTSRRQIGFERISDGAEVYRLLRNMQRRRA